MSKEKDLDLFRLVNTAEESVDEIVSYHKTYKLSKTNF